MASFGAKMRERNAAMALADLSYPPLVVYFVLDGVEHGAVVPPGGDRWDTVAHAIGRRLGCEVRAEEPPAYDRGTRHWTLPVSVAGRWRRTQVMQVAVRWGEGLSGAR